MIYSEIVAAVENFINRTEADAFVPTFISLAEVEMNRRLDTREMMGVVSLPISSEATTLPCDFAGVKAFRLVSSPQQKLEYVRPDAFDSYTDGAVTGGTAKYYTIVGNQVLVWPVQSTAVQTRLRYRAKLNPLTAAGVSNWVSEDHPDLYIYGALKHAGLFLGHELTPTWAAAFDEGIERLNREAIANDHGSTMQVQAEVYA